MALERKRHPGLHNAHKGTVVDILTLNTSSLGLGYLFSYWLLRPLQITRAKIPYSP